LPERIYRPFFLKRLSMKLLIGTCVALFLLLPLPARSLVHFDFEEPYFYDPGMLVKDHALIKADSVHHLYYIRAPLQNPSAFAQNSFGHATSKDLVHWTIHSPVLETVPGTWESGCLWAPHVIRDSSGTYVMFYTGTDSNLVQQTGMASSTDLFNWSRLSADPVYHPDTSWADWSDTAWADCRDPFVFSYGGSYYMLNSARTKTNEGAVSLAGSDDLVNWTDLGPCYVHYRDQLSWHSIESPFYVIRNGWFHFFFTEDQVPGTSYMSTDAMCAGWDLGAREVVDAGLAAEVLDDGAGKYIFSRFAAYTFQDTTRYVIRFDSLRFVGETPEVVYASRLKPGWNVLWGDAFAHQPTFGDNPLERGAESAGLEGKCWIGTNEYYEGPLQAGSPGGVGGEWRTGVLKSRGFVVEGDTLSLLVGGGNKPDSVYVGLCDACSDRMIFRETGLDSETMTRRYWDLSQLRGDSVYVKIVDLATGEWGHINVDDIVETGGGGPPQGGYSGHAVTLIAPNGGELLLQGEQFMIRWSLDDTLTADSLVLSYSIDDGLTFPYRIASVALTDTSFLWEVPAASSDACRLRVVAFDDSPACDCDGSDGVFSIHLQPTSVPSAPAGTPRERLLEISPNPFNPSTRIRVTVPELSFVRLQVFDIAGRRVRSLAARTLQPGRYVFEWDGRDTGGRDCASGVYLVNCKVGGKSLSRKLALVR